MVVAEVEAVEPVDDPVELLDVGVAEVALERRRLDGLDRERSQQLPGAAERIAEPGQDGAAVLGDRRLEGRDLVGRVAGQRVGREPA